MTEGQPKVQVAVASTSGNFPSAARESWVVRPLIELKLSDGQPPIRADEARSAALMIPPAVSLSGDVLAGGRQVQIARHLGWTCLGVREFADVNDPAVLAQVAWDRACEVGTPSLSEQSAYLREVVRPAFEERREASREHNAAQARLARAAQTLRPDDNPSEVAESATSERIRLRTFSDVASTSDSEVAESATSESPAVVGPWRDVMASNLVGVGRDQIEKFQQMEKWVTDPDLSDVGRLRIQKEIDAANADRKVNPHFLAAQKIHLAETASEDERRAALRYRTLRQFDDAVSALDRFVAQHSAAAFADLVRQSPLDTEALQEEQVPAAYRVLAWVDEVAELVRGIRRSESA